MNEAMEQVTQPTPSTESPAAAPTTAPAIETPAEAASGGSGKELRDLLPEEIRDHPSLASIKDVPNLGRSFVNAQRLIGPDKIALPKNPTEEDMNNIFSKLGRPEEPTGYGLQADGVMITEDVVNNYQDVAHKLGLTPTQATGILDYYRRSLEQASESVNQHNETQIQDTESKLKAEWGVAYEDKVAGAHNIVSEYASKELLQMKLADGTKIGNHPAFIKAFSNIADFKKTVTSEDTIKEGASNNRLTPADAQSKIDAIMNDKSHAYWDRKNAVARHKAVEEVKGLYEMVSGR